MIMNTPHFSLRYEVLTKIICKCLNCLLEVAVSTIGVFRRSTLPDKPVVTNMRFRNINNVTGAFSRAIALLLMLLIVYGTTVEAAHRHSKVLSSQGTAASLDLPGDSDNSLNSKSGCNDCLICQLHQNFNATLITSRHDAPEANAQFNSQRLEPISILSRVETPLKGRAPPQVN